MGWTAPVNIGHGNGTGSSPITGVTTPAGATIIVIAAQLTTVIGSVVDSAANTYTAASSANSSGVVTGIFVSAKSSPLVSGTITFNGAAGAGTDTVATAFYSTGNHPVSPLDLVTTPVITNSSGSTVTITSGTPTAGAELFVAALGSNAGAPITQGSGWPASPPVAVFSVNSNLLVYGGALINSGLGSETYTPGLTAGSQAVLLMISLKATFTRAHKLKTYLRR